MNTLFRRFYSETRPLDTISNAVGLLEMIEAIDPDCLTSRGQTALSNLQLTIVDLIDDATYKIANP